MPTPTCESLPHLLLSGYDWLPSFPYTEMSLSYCHWVFCGPPLLTPLLVSRFMINIGQEEGDINLNFNVNFDENLITLKTLKGDQPGNEKKLPRFTFMKGQWFEVRPSVFVSPRHQVPSLRVPCFIVTCLEEHSKILVPQFQGRGWCTGGWALDNSVTGQTAGMCGVWAAGA